MAEILGLGLTHSPSFIRPDEDGESSSNAPSAPTTASRPN